MYLHRSLMGGHLSCHLAGGGNTSAHLLLLLLLLLHSHGPLLAKPQQITNTAGMDACRVRIGFEGGLLQDLVTRMGRLSTRQGVGEGLTGDKISKIRKRIAVSLLSAHVKMKCTPERIPFFIVEGRG
jgi:hypothetical protein